MLCSPSMVHSGQGWEEPISNRNIIITGTLLHARSITIPVGNCVPCTISKASVSNHVTPLRMGSPHGQLRELQPSRRPIQPPWLEDWTMEQTSLASLSLTHVHYVSFLFGDLWARTDKLCHRIPPIPFPTFRHGSLSYPRHYVWHT